MEIFDLVSRLEEYLERRESLLRADLSPGERGVGFEEGRRVLAEEAGRARDRLYSAVYGLDERLDSLGRD